MPTTCHTHKRTHKTLNFYYPNHMRLCCSDIAVVPFFDGIFLIIFKIFSISKSLTCGWILKSILLHLNRINLTCGKVCSPHVIPRLFIFNGIVINIIFLLLLFCRYGTIDEYSSEPCRWTALGTSSSRWKRLRNTTCCTKGKRTHSVFFFLSLLLAVFIQQCIVRSAACLHHTATCSETISFLCIGICINTCRRSLIPHTYKI